MLPTKAFHPRQSHSKSRTGCDTCKRRKKKCDEAVPSCYGCVKQKVPCCYNGLRKSSLACPRKSPQSPSIRYTFNGLHGLESDEIEPFHQFCSQTLGTLGSESVQEVVASCLAAALDLDYLKHAILSLAASHLRYLSGHHDLRMIRHLHKALPNFRQRLSYSITSSEVDAVLTTCVLLDTIAFSKSYKKHSDSWLYSDTLDMQWLTLHIGLRSVMHDIKDLLHQCSWASVYKKDAKLFHSPTQTLSDESIPKSLKNYFNITSGLGASHSVYYSTLNSLLPLLTAKPSDISPSELMAIVYRFRPEFYGLLYSKDLGAVLLLAYWLGLMCQVQLWWVSNRATSECFSCCKYLEHHGGDVVRGLISFPARCCDYPLAPEYEESWSSFVPAA